MDLIIRKTAKDAAKAAVEAAHDRIIARFGSAKAAPVPEQLRFLVEAIFEEADRRYARKNI